MWGFDNSSRMLVSRLDISFYMCLAVAGELISRHGILCEGLKVVKRGILEAAHAEEC